jgi:hypothetical protein
MPRGTCSICAAPVEIRDAVAHALKRKEKLRDIAARCQFSKSALHRHAQNCLRRVILQEAKTARNNSSRVIVLWSRLDGTKDEIPRDVRDNDTLVCVTFEELDVRAICNANPRALPPTPQVIETLHEAALAEDSKRATAKLDALPT